MAMIDNLENIFVFNNRLVDDTKKAEKYKHIEKVQQTESELKSGKLIKIKTFRSDKKVKIFRVTAYTNFSRIDGQ